MLVSLLLVRPSFAADLIQRAQDTPRKLSDGTLQNRVEKDDAGHVTRLVLDEMQLTADDFAEIGKLEHLRRISLFRTSTTDADLKQLQKCRALQGVVLTSTEVTDAAINSLLELQQLQSVCLGDVRISPEAIARLKAETSKRDQRLSLGYSQRKP
jgi:hypothetical protein